MNPYLKKQLISNFMRDYYESDAWVMRQVNKRLKEFGLEVNGDCIAVPDDRFSTGYSEIKASFSVKNCYNYDKYTCYDYDKKDKVWVKDVLSIKIGELNKNYKRYRRMIRKMTKVYRKRAKTFEYHRM